MEYELAEYNEDRTRQFALLLQKQHEELAQVDNEITNLGINVGDLAESMQDVHFFAANAAMHFSPDRQSFSSNNNNNNMRSAMIHIQRSNSSNSFVSNSTNAHRTSSYK